MEKFIFRVKNTRINSKLSQINFRELSRNLRKTFGTFEKYLSENFLLSKNPQKILNEIHQKLHKAYLVLMKVHFRGGNDSKNIMTIFVNVKASQYFAKDSRTYAKIILAHWAFVLKFH